MEKLIIKNFKCFIDTEIELNKLTVFAGGNGNGKSTAIQSLLYLRRTIEHCGIWSSDKNGKQYVYKDINGLNVELNESYCLALGTSDNVLPLNSSELSINLGISSNKEEIIVTYDVSDETELYLKPRNLENTTAEYSSIFKQCFYYLNAERFGPRIKQSVKFYDYPNTGYRGEFTAQLLGDTAFSYKYEVPENRRFDETKSPRIEHQTNAWLDFILPGVKINAQYDANLMTAQIKVSNKFTNGEPVFATNIGFGISYVLPIIVTALIADFESYFVVENPEAHLHPFAQSKIGEFLAIIAMTGVKVVIETHSDHVLNGIQIAVAKEGINSKDVTINYFSSNPEIDQPEITPISINEKGELSVWPKGFFDQSLKDYSELLKIRKNG
jgi:predicted ATPase